MGWSKLDHEFFRNPKVIDLPGPAKLVYLAALCHSGEQLTDGFVSKGAYAALCGLIGAPRNIAAHLNVAGLWDETKDGWQIHDYAAWQSSAEQVKAQRKATADRVQRLRNKPRNGVTSPVTNPATPAVSNTALEVRSKKLEPTKASSSTNGCNADIDVAAAALEIIADRRPPATSNPAGYRRAVLAGLAKDHADTLAQLDLAAFTPATLADWLEPPPTPKPAEIRPPLRDARPPCDTCSGSGMVLDGAFAQPCPECNA